MCGVFYAVVQPITNNTDLTTLDFLYEPLAGAAALVQWLICGTGPMSSLTSEVGLL